MRKLSRGHPVPTRKRPHTAQSTFPHYSLERALQIPRAIVDELRSSAAAPDAAAAALGLKPSGGSWRLLIGSAVAYGLLEGGYNTTELTVTPRASAILAPTAQNAARHALQEALLEPLAMRQFIEKYQGGRLPRRHFGINVLVGFGVPRERGADALAMIETNLRFAGGIIESNEGPVIAVDSVVRRPREGVTAGSAQSTIAAAENVYVSIGDDAELLDTLRRALGYGKRIPVVPIHDRFASDPTLTPLVLEGMRSCRGAVVKLRRDGAHSPSIDPAVMLEIGAALALYGGNVIVLAERDLDVPGVLLQGCFMCTYERNHFDGEAMMRLLEGLSGFENR